MTMAAAGGPWQPRPVGRTALLWTGAAVVAVAAHGAAAWWALHRPEASGLPPSPPEAVMIEFAPEAVAPQSDMMELAPDLQDIDEVDAPDTLDQPDEPTMVEDQPTPAPEIAPLTPPPDLAPAPVPPTVIPEVALPPPPRQVEKPPPVKAEKKADVAKPPAPKKEQRQAKSLDAAPASKAAAPESGSGSVGKAQQAAWSAKLSAHLNRRKRYPSASRARREEGVVSVRFTVDGSGNVLSSSLVKSSGFAALDDEALTLLKRASPVPMPPGGQGRTVTVPIRFDMK